jgi:fructoselysine-6-P-deglycase FrlB-like protein
LVVKGGSKERICLVGMGGSKEVYYLVGMTIQ